MCLECDGLGHIYSFDPDLLVPDASLSFKQGCFELLGNWKKQGRWRRHIYQGVAETVTRAEQWPEELMLETPWQDLPQPAQQYWLWGTGTRHITFTWRGGRSPMKYGGRFEGIIPELLSKYRSSRSRIQLRRLEKYMNTILCPECMGDRLNAQARSVQILSGHDDFKKAGPFSLPAVCRLSVRQAADFFEQLELDATGSLVAEEVVKEIRARLGFLVNVGLDYLALNRTAPTLSGGESQRIRLAAQIGSGLVGITYILDEPSIGLHPRDNDQLLDTLCQLRDMGNTVIVVEHDEETMRSADHVIDFGPGAGVQGGKIVASGSIEAIVNEPTSVTGQFLSGRRQIPVPQQRRKVDGPQLVVRGAEHNNLKQVDMAIPLGCFTCVTGVSGSGKSSLVNDILAEALRRDLNHGQGSPGKHVSIEGLDHLDKMIAIDQSPIGRTPRSNPATYIKVFDDIRKLFAQLPNSKRRGYKPGRFSFNVKDGRCDACDGNGTNRLEMDFLADVWVTCPVCEGKRFNRETLQVQFKGYSIADVLQMDIQEALELFENIPAIRHKLNTLHDVGLDYLKLGQPSPTLSGGEAQRIKLARELVKKSTGSTLYLLDEPTTGLHFADIEMLLQVLHQFADGGNTVVVVEHNLDVIKTADWIIDLGPEGGERGGEIVVAGTPETTMRCSRSATGKALKHAASGSRRSRRKKQTAAQRTDGPGRDNRWIRVQGARQHNLKNIDVKIARDKITVFSGPSGSGKTSLAMDTIYAEGQRRYVESLGSYARQFISQMQKPLLDQIDGLSPSIAIEQKNLGNTPRSTVGTVTELYDYFRVLLARLGTPFCPDCECPVSTQTSDQVVDKVLAAGDQARLYLMSPIRLDHGQDYDALWDEIRSQGYQRVRVDGQVFTLDAPPSLDRKSRHEVEVVVDRIVVRQSARSRIAESVETALGLGQGVVHVAAVDEKRDEKHWDVTIHSQHRVCGECGRSFEALTPHNFSFNSFLGWCSSCEGLGTQTGANPAALLDRPDQSLRDGVLTLWPDLADPVSRAMLQATSETLDIPADVPYARLSPKQRRTLLYGSQDRWIEVPVTKTADGGTAAFRFQFKGLYPALEEASRLSPSLRTRLEHLVDLVECSRCGGSRLRDDAGSVRFRGKTIDQYCRLPLSELLVDLKSWKLDRREKGIAGELFREIRDRLRFLNEIGLHYLTLQRTSASLSNGEAQRIRLASQLGSGLCGVLYVLDEPTIGLHPRDNQRLLKALERLRDLGNTLLVVEHDRAVIEGADWLLDFGPGSGRHGGRIIAQGTAAQVARNPNSLTGPYLNGKKSIPVPSNRRPVDSRQGKWLEVIGARHNNLDNVDLKIPLGTLSAVTGPSGSGKSSLIDEVLYAELARRLHRASRVAGPHERIIGLQYINKVIRVNQNSLGNSPSSNPATYTGVMDLIRTLFAQLPEAKLRGYSPRRFSFNAPGGRCDDCEGNGQTCVEMHFLPDIWVECQTCQGRRYNPETLLVTYRGHSISDVLQMTCEEAATLFQNIPKIRRILQTLCDVGLEYLTLGQPAPTLSGGEAQRVKLSAELARPDTGQTLYLLDEPTTGLHFEDLAKLLEVLNRLVDLGNTVVVIEHNLDLIKTADWVIDMGPEAGLEGGQIVATGTPEQLARRGSGKRVSHTGRALQSVLKKGDYQQRPRYSPLEAEQQREGDLEIKDVGKETSVPWEVDGRQWHTVDRVDRKGGEVRWDGRILATVIDRIHEMGAFSDTDFSSRSVVEIAATRKSMGWFFHAITAETWLLKMKFRVARGTFRREELVPRLGLATLNQMEELPVYGNQPRTKVRSRRGPWQEVEIRAYSWQEIDTPGFWHFLEEAVAGFQEVVSRSGKSLEDLTPWKQLGQKWHFMRKGFTLGRPVAWSVELLEELHQMLAETLPQGNFLWSNKQLVHLYDQDGRHPWVSIQTKKTESLVLFLSGPRGCTTLGRVAELGYEPTLDSTNPERETVQIHFRSQEDLYRGDLPAFLAEHLETCRQLSRRKKPLAST
jgi:excinuclease ABC subunit A